MVRVKDLLTDYFQSVMAESFATTWQHWLVAKLLSGMGVGMLQSTLPLYLTEISPSQLRGFFVNAYSLYGPSFDFLHSRSDILT